MRWTALPRVIWMVIRSSGWLVPPACAITSSKRSPRGVGGNALGRLHVPEHGDVECGVARDANDDLRHVRLAVQSSDDFLLDLAQRSPCRRRLTGKGNCDRAGRADLNGWEGVGAAGWNVCADARAEGGGAEQSGWSSFPDRHFERVTDADAGADRNSVRSQIGREIAFDLLDVDTPGQIVSNLDDPHAVQGGGPCGSFFNRLTRRAYGRRTGGDRHGKGGQRSSLVSRLAHHVVRD